MNKKNVKFTGLSFLIFAILIGNFVNLGGIPKSNEIFGKNIDNSYQIETLIPKISADQITSENVTLNITGDIRRGVDTLNITVDNSTWFDVNPYDTIFKFKVNITLNDGKQFNLTMEHIPEYGICVALFTPWITNATGFANLTVFGVDSNDETISIGEDYVPDYMIRIVNNAPKVGVSLNSFEFDRGDLMTLEFTPSDVEDGMFNLEWEISLRNGTNNIVEMLIPRGVRNLTDSFEIPLDYEVKSMFINGTCWDSDGESSTNQYFISIENNEPIITNVVFDIQDEVVSADDLKNNGILRYSETLTIKLNCTDFETNKSLRVTYEAIDPQTGLDIWDQTVSMQDQIPVDDTDTYFYKEITFPRTMGLGICTLRIILEDQLGDVDEKEFSVLILNNNPVLEGFAINDTKSEQINFKQGDYITFTFNVSDVENSIEFVQVNIFYQDGQLTKSLNYSLAYINENTTIMIRARDLPAADFMVYASVIDSDGGRGNSDFYSFAILPKEGSDLSTWLLFVVGIIIGLIVGAGILYWKNKDKNLGETEDIIASSEKPTSNKVKGEKNTNNNKLKNETKSDKKVIRRL